MSSPGCAGLEDGPRPHEPLIPQASKPIRVSTVRAPRLYLVSDLVLSRDASLLAAEPSESQHQVNFSLHDGYSEAHRHFAPMGAYGPMANETRRERLKSSTLPSIRPYVYNFDGLVSSEHVSHGWGEIPLNSTQILSNAHTRGQNLASLTAQITHCKQASR